MGGDTGHEARYGQAEEGNREWCLEMHNESQGGQIFALGGRSEDMCNMISRNEKVVGMRK